MYRERVSERSAPMQLLLVPSQAPSIQLQQCLFCLFPRCRRLSAAAEARFFGFFSAFLPHPSSSRSEIN